MNEIEFREKSFLWYFTFFARSNYTTIGNTIYFPKGKFPSQQIINHEMIHMKQQQECGLFKFLLLYGLVLPFLWNPWRFKWEYEAYTKGSKFSSKRTIKELRSVNYGWLILNKVK